MDIYLNADSSQAPGINFSIDLKNKDNIFIWAARFFTYASTTKEVVFLHQIRKVYQRPDGNYFRNQELEFEFKEEDLELLGRTLQFAHLKPSSHNDIFVWTLE